jgi:hypothetical protein
MKINYFALLLVSVFILSCEQQGCTDSAALNFDPNATKDDGSCDYESENYVGVYTIHDSLKHVFSFTYAQGTREISIGPHPFQPVNLVFTNMFLSGTCTVFGSVSEGHFDFPAQTIRESDGTPSSYEISYLVGDFVGDSIYYKFTYTNSLGDPYSGGGSGKRQ